MGTGRRNDDEASASMVTYVVAAAVFITGSTFLFGFVVESPGSSTVGLQQLDLRTQATTALDILLGTPGLPVAWDADAEAIDGLDRLGLIEQGTSIRVDADKFDAVARGRYSTSSTTNGFVDYAEAKRALGLNGYDFHLRAYPLLDVAAEGTYGTEDMDDFSIGYVGRIDDADPATWGEQATGEVAALALLGLDFDTSVRVATTGTGDVYRDSSQDLRSYLLPNIGSTIEQTVLSGGSGANKYDFGRVAGAVHDGLVTSSTTGALALSLDTDDDGLPDTLGYTKNREIRAVVASFDMGLTDSATVEWSEWVDTDRGNLSYDCGDRGFAEYSLDNGANWRPLNNGRTNLSQDCSDLSDPTQPVVPHGLAMTAKAVGFHCGGPCGDVLIAFRWLGDNDQNIGYGWVIDDLHVHSGGTTHLRKSFETVEYDMLIIGSEVDHSALVPNDIKNAIRDYVDIYGGRLLVLGGGENGGNGEIQWLDRLFDVGIGGGSGGVSTPDTTHPLLTLPNTLAYESYPTHDELYLIEGEDAELFSMVIGEDDELHALAVAREGAFGSGTSTDGSVILSAFRPYELDATEAARFLANSVVYGKYHYLYLEVGPEIPNDEAVASAGRSATMNMYRTGEPEYMEMGFLLYVWPGQSVEDTWAVSVIEPMPVRELEAATSGSTVVLTWEPPAAWGTGTPHEYRIFHGTTLDPTTPLGTVSHGATLEYPHNPPTGSTYYYVIRAISLDEDGLELEGMRSAMVSATPVDLVAAPTVTATPGLSSVTLTWPTVWTTKTGNLYGHAVYASTDGTTYELVSEIGNRTSYTHVPGDTTERRYKVQALNARGYGPLSAATDPAAPIAPVPAPELTATGSGDGIVLTWVAPPSGAHTITGYRIYRADTELGEYAILTTVGPTLTYTDGGLPASTTKWYKVAATTETSDGELSTAKSGTTGALPGPPENVQAASVLTVATITWTPPTTGSPVLSYNLYRGATADATTFVKSVTAAELSTTDTYSAAEPYYRVRAVSAVGEGAWSAANSAAS